MNSLFGDTGTIVNGIVKFGSIALLLVYAIFAVLVIRQIELMIRTFKTDNEGNVRILGWIHLGITLALLLLAIIL